MDFPGSGRLRGKPAASSRATQPKTSPCATCSRPVCACCVRNYRTPGRGGGEIDLIMRDRDGTWCSSRCVHAVPWAWWRRGQHRYRQAPAHRVCGAPLPDGRARRPPCRFDVVPDRRRPVAMAARGVRCRLNRRVGITKRCRCTGIIIPMLEQRIEQQFIDSADLKYQAAQILSKPIAAAVQACWCA
jgi:Holliday junction resolvase-like predicted endonuclease